VHHLTYCRLGREDDSDLAILCSSCHSQVHEIKHGKYRGKFMGVFNLKWEKVKEENPRRCVNRQQAAITEKKLLKKMGTIAFYRRAQPES